MVNQNIVVTEITDDDQLETVQGGCHVAKCAPIYSYRVGSYFGGRDGFGGKISKPVASYRPSKSGFGASWCW